MKTLQDRAPGEFATLADFVALDGVKLPDSVKKPVPAFALDGLTSLLKAVLVMEQSVAEAGLDVETASAVRRKIADFKKAVGGVYFECAGDHRKNNRPRRAAFCDHCAAQWGVVEAEETARASTWSPRAGWVSTELAEQLNKNIFPSGKDRLSAADFQSRHGDWEHAATLQGDYWVVKTDAGYSAGAELLKRLETELDYFMMEFGPELEAKIPAQKLEVYLFRSEEEYRAQFEKIAGYPAQGDTGRFHSKTGRAYFFHYDNAAGVKRGLGFEGVSQHEAAHQLFHHLTPHRLGALVQGPQFWVMEGVADFFIYLDCSGPRAKLFDEKAFAAGERFVFFTGMIEKNEHMLLRDFTRLDQEQFHALSHPVAPYAQASCLAYFLMTKRREPFFRYMKTCMMDGKSSENTFEETFGKDAVAAVDGEFLDWIKTLVPPK